MCEEVVVEMDSGLAADLLPVERRQQVAGLPHHQPTLAGRGAAGLLLLLPPAQRVEVVYVVPLLEVGAVPLSAEELRLLGPQRQPHCCRTVLVLDNLASLTKSCTPACSPVSA